MPASASGPAATTPARDGTGGVQIAPARWLPVGAGLRSGLLLAASLASVAEAADGHCRDCHSVLYGEHLTLALDAFQVPEAPVGEVDP